MKKQKEKIASGLLSVIEEYSHKVISEQLRGYVQFFIGTVINLDEKNGHAKVRYISENSSNGYTDIQVTIKTQEKIKINDAVIVIYVNNLTNSFIIAKLSSNYQTIVQKGGGNSTEASLLINKCLLKTGGTMNGAIVINEGLGGGIIFPSNGAITIDNTKNILLALTSSGIVLGNSEYVLNLNGATEALLYNGKALAFLENIETNFLSRLGGEMEGSITFPYDKALGLYWESPEGNYFIGPSSNKEDKSFTIASIEGTSFENGLAIDGTSQELYWKNQRVATETDLDLKVDKEEGKGLSTNDFTDELKEKLENLDGQIGNELDKLVEEVNEKLDLKVDKEEGKGLSSNDFTDKYKNQLDLLDDNLQSQVNNLTNLISTKQDKKPNGSIDLINVETGKIDTSYIPKGIGEGRKFAGTFGEDGVISASVYANEINGQNINLINRDECIGYEFTYIGAATFELGLAVAVPDGGGAVDIPLNVTNKFWELNNGDVIISNGNLQEQSWTIIDNSDKVISVNGQTGAVEIDLGSMNAVPAVAGDNSIAHTENGVILNTYKDFIDGDLTLDNAYNVKLTLDGQIASISTKGESKSGAELQVAQDEVSLNYRGPLIAGGRTPNSSVTVGGKILMSGDISAVSSYTPALAYAVTNTASFDLTPGDFSIVASREETGLPSIALPDGTVEEPTDTKSETIFNVSSTEVSINGERVLVESDLQNLDLDAKLPFKILTGTQEKPINLAKDLVAGHIYYLAGYIDSGHKNTNGDKLLYITNYVKVQRDTLIVAKFYNATATSLENLLSTSNGEISWDVAEDFIVLFDGDAESETAGMFAAILNANNSFQLNKGMGDPESFTEFNVVYAPTGPGLSGQILKSNGQDQPPTWRNLPTLKELTNDAGFITASDIPDIPSISGLATENYVDTAVANLVGTAPETLNTIEELSGALRDNKDIVTVLENSIATKANANDLNNYLPLSGGVMTGELVADEIRASTGVSVKIKAKTDSTSAQGVSIYSGQEDSCYFAMYGTAGSSSHLLGGLGIHEGAPVFYQGTALKEIALKSDIPTDYVPISGNSTINGSLTANSFVGRLQGTDTRNVDSAPSEYQTQAYKITEFQEFKTATTIGAPNPNDKGFIYLKTFTPWGDSTGGLPIQLAIGNGIALRKAISSTEWGEWETLGGSADLASKADRNNSEQTFVAGNITVSSINLLV